MRSKDPSRPQSTQRQGAGTKGYAGVTIVASGACCPEVRGLLGAPVLIAKAPKLPLANCSTPMQCQCRFGKKSTDRRDNDDERRFHSGSTRSVWFAGHERRKSTGRRDND